MAKLVVFGVVAGLCAVLSGTEVSSAESLTDQIGLTASSAIAIGWLGLLSLLALALIVPLLRR
jgi:hypothetical protein